MVMLPKYCFFLFWVLQSALKDTSCFQIVPQPTLAKLDALSHWSADNVNCPGQLHLFVFSHLAWTYSFATQAWSSLLSLKFVSWWAYLDLFRSGGHMFVWALLILNQTGTLECAEPSTGQWCGECGRKVGQDSFIGVPTAMRRQWFQVLRYAVAWKASLYDDLSLIHDPIIFPGLCINHLVRFTC
jgi:hypothetical protein